MPRPPRLPSASAIYHVMNRGVDRQDVFFADVDRQEFERRLVAIRRRFGVTTLAYCLMDNHFHLVLQAPEGNLSEGMHHLTSVYSRHTNDRLGRDGPLFRGRFHSIPVESDAYFAWVVRYVHRNALDIRGVTSPRDHRWSSYRSYVGAAPVPSFLDVEVVLALFGGSREEFVAFTEDKGDPTARGHVLRPTSSADLRHLVLCALAVDDSTHAETPASRPHADRTLLTLVAARSSPVPLALLTAAVGSRSREAERKARRHAEARLVADDGLDRTLTWLLSNLGAPPSELRRAG